MYAGTVSATRSLAVARQLDAVARLALVAVAHRTIAMALRVTTSPRNSTRI